MSVLIMSPRKCHALKSSHFEIDLQPVLQQVQPGRCFQHWFIYIAKFPLSALGKADSSVTSILKRTDYKRTRGISFELTAESDSFQEPLLRAVNIVCIRTYPQEYDQRGTVPLQQSQELEP